MRILIVDDERPSRGELRYILQQLAATAEIVEATNGHEALTAVARESLDVVFLDINMPGLNGLAAAAAIAERPDPPLIVFATAYDAHAVRAFELAALDYVVKPFDERRLAQTMVRIREALAAREKRDAQQSAVRAYLAGAAAPTLHKLWGERDEETAVLVDAGSPGLSSLTDFDGNVRDSLPDVRAYVWHPLTEKIFLPLVVR